MVTDSASEVMLKQDFYIEIFPSKYSSTFGITRHYVRLKSVNGQTLNISQGYTRKWNAKRAAKRMFPTLQIKYVDYDDSYRA